MDHIIMAAADLGLGTCWVAAFDPAAARQAFKLAPEAEPLVFTPLGFPAEMARAKQRKPPEALVRRVEWS
jgi:nitroreductase